VKDGNKSLFYDTYALCAIALAEQSYKEFSQGIDIQTSLMNLYELYYILIKEGHEETAERIFNQLLSSCISITPDILKSSAKFRKGNIKLKLSYIDCLGYTIAKNIGIKFLTGDEGFRDLDNVLFIK